MRNISIIVSFVSFIASKFEGSWCNSWICIFNNSPKLWSFLGPLGDTFLLTNGIGCYEIYRLRLPLGGIWWKHNNKIFIGSARSAVQTFYVCSTIMSYFFYLLSARAREMVRWTLDQLSTWEVSDSLLEGTLGRGEDIDSDNIWPSIYQDLDFCFSGVTWLLYRGGSVIILLLYVRIECTFVAFFSCIYVCIVAL